MGNTSWTYRPLSELCDINIGKTPSRSKKEYWGKGHTWVSISDLKSKTIFTTKEEITDIALTDSNIRMVKKGTLLMSFKLSIGKLAFAGKDLYTNEAIVGLPVKRGIELDSDYLYYALGFIPLAGGNQAAMGKTLNKKSLAALSIPLPPNLEDQKRIAKILSECESLIQKRKDSIELLDELLRSTFLEMFGDTFSNKKQYDKKTIEEVCSNIVDCPHSTPKYIDYESDFPCIRTSEIKNGEINWTSMKYTDKEGYLKRVERLIPLAGDIVFAREGIVGDAAIIPDGINLSLGQRVMLFRVKSDIILPEFFWASIKSPGTQHSIKSRTIAATVRRINIADVKKIKLIIPPIGEQKIFVGYVSKLRTIKKLMRNSLDEIVNLRGSLSQRAFKGELDLSKVDISDMEDSTKEKPEMEPIGDPRWEGKVELQDYQVHIDEIIKKDFENSSFSFNQLESAIADRGFYVPYEGVKEFVFKSLVGNESLLVQELDEKEKQIVFKIRS